MLIVSAVYSFITPIQLLVNPSTQPVLPYYEQHTLDFLITSYHATVIQQSNCSTFTHTQHTTYTLTSGQLTPKPKSTTVFLGVLMVQTVVIACLCCVKPRSTNKLTTDVNKGDKIFLGLFISNYLILNISYDHNAAAHCMSLKHRIM